MTPSLATLKNALRFRRRSTKPASDRFLEVRNLSKSFGVLSVLKGVSFSVTRGQIWVIIGPNGAGKSTLLKLISGLMPFEDGQIWFRGCRLNGIPPHRIAALGITQLFQDIQLFTNMSVIENVMLGCHLLSRANLLASGLRLPSARNDEGAIFKRAMSQLELVGLAERAFARPGSLSWGQQKLVGLARALASGAELLLLDEPYGGLQGDEIVRLNHLVQELHRQGMTILIIEHLTDILMGIADRVIVLDHGEKIAEGTPAEIKSNRRVIDAYLGDE